MIVRDVHAESGFAEVNGTRLFYTLAGNGHPLVLIHGFSLDMHMWDDQFETFARHYHVLRYDLRGFGRSALPDALSYGHEDDLKALLDYLGIKRADVIGLSLGGMIAIDFALTYPDSIRALVPVDAGLAGFAMSAEWNARTNLIREIARERGIPAAKESWLDHPLFGPIGERPEAAGRLAQMVTDYSGWHFINDDPAVSPRPHAAQRLGDIKAATLIVLGERDLPDFHQMAGELERQVPGACKVVLPKVGHMANMEDPAGFNAITLQFLEGELT
jgi:pimeloyl-ACP methyl ester carboxylesterase